MWITSMCKIVFKVTHMHSMSSKHVEDGIISVGTRISVHVY